MPNTICLKGSGILGEAKSAAIITPGELLDINAGDLLIPHGTAAGNHSSMVATENSLIGNGIDTDYASGDTVHYIIPHRGSELYMFLAAGENAAAGNFLDSDGNGDLQVHTPLTDDGSSGSNITTAGLNFQAAEDVDNSGGGTRVRIRVRAV